MAQISYYGRFSIIANTHEVVNNSFTRIRNISQRRLITDLGHILTPVAVNLSRPAGVWRLASDSGDSYRMAHHAARQRA
jgi:hypothetical protein